MKTKKIDAKGHWLEVGAADSFLRMAAVAKTIAGLVVAGRTKAQQAALYDNYLHHGGNLAAPPGKSLHESGLAFDATRLSPLQVWLTHGGDPMKVRSGEKIRANEYGWHRTVPSEAWHFRYYPAKDKHKAKPKPKPKVLVPTLARVATFNCAGWSKKSMPAKQINGLVGAMLAANASIYLLTECPEWLRNHIRGLCSCPTKDHRRIGPASKWTVRARGDQAILRNSSRWKPGPWDAASFGPTSYHGWVKEELTSVATGAKLTVAAYHLPPNSVSSQTYQRVKLQGFLKRLSSGFRLVGGDGADQTSWFTGWNDARINAKASANRNAATYQGKSITDRIHGKGITFRGYSVISSKGASDHNPVLTQITIPAN